MEFGFIAASLTYFSILTIIGIYFYRKGNNNSEQFVSGGHSLNYWVTAIATQASDMGAWLFLGFPAMVFLNGMSEYWTAIGLVVFMWLNWRYIAPRLRRQTEKLKSVTLADYFTKRYNDTSGLLALSTSVISLVFFVFYISSGLVGLGRIFQSAFNIEYHSGIIMSMMIALFYTLLGGFVAIAWCDFFQGLFLLGVIVIVPLYAYTHTGGITEIVAIAAAKNISLSLISSWQQTIQAILLAAGWGLGYFGQPHILVNFIGIDDPKNIKYAQRVGITWQILVLTASACIGLISIAFFKNTTIEPQMIFVSITTVLFHPFVAGLALCAIFAATLSSVDTQLLTAGTLAAQQLHKLIYKDARHSNSILLSRIVTALVALCSLTVAWNNNNSIYNLVYFAWSGLGAAFGPLTICSLYHKNITRDGALAGIIIGTITVIIWPYFNSSVMQLVPGFIASYLGIIIVSNTQKSTLFCKYPLDNK